ncbi:MAG: hypothetical protein GXP23_10365 [Gammaproteobacteria bacterium]|nr:hypothetical protein [Gammaproteobacteria bacterium]
MPNTARAGDTIEVALGRSTEFSRNNIQATVVDSLGVLTVIPAGDPAFRAVVNLYPDPLSGMVVGTATNQNAGEYNNGATSGGVINSATGGDEDWWETVVFLDLPAGMAAGSAVLRVETLDASEFSFLGLEIIPGTGQPVDFATTIGSLTSTQVQSLERVSHYEVSLSGASLPYAASITLLHDPDVSLAGVGVPHVVNPRGDIKSMVWADDGTQLKVILTPANGGSIDAFPDFKFYVTGGITGLLVSNVEAYDSNGGVVPGVTATALPGTN